MSGAPYTLKPLTEVPDMAPEFGVAETQEVRFARAALDAEHVGFAFHRVKPGTRQGIGHKHDHPEAEEVYVVIAGAGRVKLDDETFEIARLDAIRVAPHVVRSFEAGPDGIEFLAFGPRHDGDGEAFFGWWTD
ncbi:MAG TPA: cupin domain-containing protein [Thermoleophilaceae bacterium]|jgi:quercetin dioxygenase-like cupin family protein|nr:cupin domain-containing protein [Thermoleophilaceae bacterium]